MTVSEHDPAAVDPSGGDGGSVLPAVAPGAWRTLDAPTLLRLDVFPATVTGATLPTRPGEAPANPANLRVMVTDDHWLIFADTDAGPDAVTFGELYHVQPAERGHLITTTAAHPGSAGVGGPGPRFTAVRTPGACGCRSRLRGFRPYPGVRLLGAPRRRTF